MKALIDKVWPLTVAIMAFLVANGDAIGSLVTGEIAKAGDDFSWKTLLIIGAGILTMVNVWSKDSARKLAASEPHSLDAEGV